MTFGADVFGEAFGGARPRRLAGLVGHFAPQILISAIVAAVVIGVHPIGDGTSPLAILLPVLLMFLVLGTWVLMRQHDQRLCEQCMSSMPLNPSETASRYKSRFWTAHAGGNKRILVSYLVVLISSNFLVTFAPSLMTRVVWGTIQLSMIYLVASYVTHRKLQPWCPQCQGGDGGDEEKDRVTPDPSDHRQLV